MYEKQKKTKSRNKKLKKKKKKLKKHAAGVLLSPEFFSFGFM